LFKEKPREKRGALFFSDTSLSPSASEIPPPLTVVADPLLLPPSPPKPPPFCKNGSPPRLAKAQDSPLCSGPKVWPALHLFCSVFSYICLCGTSSLLLLLLMCNFFSSFTFAHVEVWNAGMQFNTEIYFMQAKTASCFAFASETK
jgi:hypothetical protein